MSLRDAILGLVEDMLMEAEEYKTNGMADPKTFSIVLSSYARTLKALALVEGSSPPIPQGVMLSPQAQHFAEIEKAKGEFRKHKEYVHAEEGSLGGDMAEVVGGPANPDGVHTVQSVDPKMPAGAKTSLGGGVYVLRIVNGQKILEWESNIALGG